MLYCKSPIVLTYVCLHAHIYKCKGTYHPFGSAFCCPRGCSTDIIGARLILSWELGRYYYYFLIVDSRSLELLYSMTYRSFDHHNTRLYRQPSRTLPLLISTGGPPQLAKEVTDKRLCKPLTHEILSMAFNSIFFCI